ncbi:hypothetical protein VPH35_064444 [Triticum aestivum]
MHALPRAQEGLADERCRRDDPSRWPDADHATWRRGRRPKSQRHRAPARPHFRARRGTTVPAHSCPIVPPGLREHGGTPPPVWSRHRRHRTPPKTPLRPHIRCCLHLLVGG